MNTDIFTMVKDCLVFIKHGRNYNAEKLFSVVIKARVGIFRNDLALILESQAFNQAGFFFIIVV